MAKLRRWVVKAGSKMVCDGGPLLMRAWMQQVAQLRKKYGIEVIWVTSGAIAWATTRTNFKKPKRNLPQKQALSAIGQPLVMDQYNLALQASGLLGSQVLLTAGDMKDAARKKNLQNTLNELLLFDKIQNGMVVVERESVHALKFIFHCIQPFRFQVIRILFLLKFTNLFLFLFLMKTMPSPLKKSALVTMTL